MTDETLYEQMIDVLTWARHNDCEEAYTWIIDAYINRPKEIG